MPEWHNDTRRADDEQRWQDESWGWSHHEHWPHPPWMHRPGPAERRRWRRTFRHRRAPLFLRLGCGFGFIALLGVGGLAALVFLLSRLFGGVGEMAGRAWILVVALAVALPLLAVTMARQAFRGIATPLADVMTAADAVADGNLSVRVDVPDHGPHAFTRLARSFNRMVKKLENADRQRRNLTADVAHELRTPLHVIQGNLEGVLDRVYEPTDEHIDATLEEARQLARLVEDLRTLSLAEAGQLALALEPVDVAELLADVETSFGGQAEAAGIELRVDVDGSLPTITGDVGRLDQVLGNLMANAIRHTPAGGTITLRARPAGDGVRLEVRDTGEGIPVEDQPYIFDRFWKGDRSRMHAAGAGSGLGLAIARQLVQAHGGRIDVTSTPGEGTTFAILLPASPEEAPHE